MGRGKRSVLASLFGLKKHRAGSGGKAAGRPQQPRYYQGTRVRPSGDDNYWRHWYPDRDIDRRASEFIERVHRGILLAGDRDG